MEMKMDLSTTIARIQAKLIQEKIKSEALSNLLISKGLISEEELDALYAELYKEKSLKYSAESMDLTEEEFKELIKEED
jgi:hypothetical protein